jgi:hypothetical protein
VNISVNQTTIAAAEEYNTLFIFRLPKLVLTVTSLDI